MTLSIITVNYQSAGLVRNLLQYWQTLDVHSKCEWIIVDNSQELDLLRETVQAVARGADVKLISSGGNKGFGAGCNLGAAAAKGQILFFLNPDCHFRGGSFENILEKLKADTSIGVVGPKLVDKENRVEFSCSRFPGVFAEAKLKLQKILADRSEKYRRKVSRGFDKIQQVDWVTGGALFMRRSVFEKVGGFDERFFLYFEDIDLCKRLQQAGYSVWFDPSLTLAHNRGGSQQTIDYDIAKIYRQSQILYYRKHNSYFSQLALKAYLYLSGKTEASV